jgi:hypothetical protein
MASQVLHLSSLCDTNNGYNIILLSIEIKAVSKVNISQHDSDDEDTDCSGSDESTDCSGSDEDTDCSGSDENTDCSGIDKNTHGSGIDENTDCCLTRVFIVFHFTIFHTVCFNLQIANFFYQLNHLIY